jgi:hypothetical protein
MRRFRDHLAAGIALSCCLLFAGVAAAAKPAPAAPPAPPAVPAAAAPTAAPPAMPAAPAGRSLRQQVEERFEVLPLSDGVLLRPRQDMAGIKALEVRDGDLAIDGRAADIEGLERRAGVAEAAPVRALLELDGDELRSMFGFSASELPEPPAPPAPPGAPDNDQLQEQIQAEMEARRAEIEQQREELRARIQEEMQQHRGDADRLREELHKLEMEGHRGRRRSDSKVVFGSTVHVERGDSSGDIIALGGTIKADGDVLGDAVAVGGPVTVHGLVNGAVVSVGGTVNLGSDARVMGDVVSVGGTVNREPGAEVGGQVTEVSMWQGLAGLGPLGMHRGPGWGGRTSYFDGALLRLLRCAVVVLVLMLLGILLAAAARHPLEQTSAAAGAEPWKAGVVGAVTIVLFLPAMALVAVLLAVSIVGIPLLLLWPFAVLACILAAFFGYIAAAHALARWSERRFGWKIQGPVTTVILGLFLLHGAWLMARMVDVVDSSQNVAGFLRVLLIIFWMLANLCALAVGIGAVLLRRRRGPAPLVVTAPAPPAPPAPAPLLPPSGPAPVYAESTGIGTAGGVTLPAAATATDVVAERPWDEPFATFDEEEAEAEAAEAEREADERGPAAANE